MKEVARVLNYSNRGLTKIMIYTYDEANRNLSMLLDKAKNDQDVFIQKENGEIFAIRFFFKKGKTYNLPDTNLDLSRYEIVSCIREVRERNI